MHSAGLPLMDKHTYMLLFSEGRIVGYKVLDKNTPLPKQNLPLQINIPLNPFSQLINERIAV